MIPVEARTEYEALVRRRAAQLIDAADAAGATARLLKSVAIEINVGWDDFERYWLDPASMPIAVCEAIAWRLADLSPLSGSADVKRRALAVLRAQQGLRQLLEQRARAERQRDWEALLNIDTSRPAERAIETLAQTELALLHRMAFGPELHRAFEEIAKIEVENRADRRPLDLIEHVKQSRALAAGGSPFSDEAPRNQDLDETLVLDAPDDDDRACRHLCYDIYDWVDDVELVGEALGRLVEGAAEWGFTAIEAMRRDPAFRADAHAFIDASERAMNELAIDSDEEQFVEEATSESSNAALDVVIGELPILFDRWRLSFDPELVAALKRRAAAMGQTQRDVKMLALESGARLAWDHRLDEQSVRLGREHVKDDAGSCTTVVPGSDLTPSELLRWMRQETLRAAKYVMLDLPYPPQKGDASRFFRQRRTRRVLERRPLSRPQRRAEHR